MIIQPDATQYGARGGVFHPSQIGVDGLIRTGLCCRRRPGFRFGQGRSDCQHPELPMINLIHYRSKNHFTNLLAVRLFAWRQVSRLLRSALTHRISDRLDLRGDPPQTRHHERQSHRGAWLQQMATVVQEEKESLLKVGLASRVGLQGLLQLINTVLIKIVHVLLIGSRLPGIFHRSDHPRIGGGVRHAFLDRRQTRFTLLKKGCDLKTK